MSFVVLFFLNVLTQQTKKRAMLCQLPILLMKYYCSIKFQGRDLPVHTLWPKTLTLRLTPLSHTYRKGLVFRKSLLSLLVT